MRLLVVAAVSTSVLVALPAVAAAAGPVRDPLAPQAQMGPTLHPSGNDRLVEHGGSGTQGWAMHDPDGDYNYGVDQNGDLGGLYTGDQDGNNGCGNDQDFEDDNNGNCGGGRPDACVDDLDDVASAGRNEHALDNLRVEECEPPSCEVSCDPVTEDPSSEWLAIDEEWIFDSLGFG